MTNYSYNYIVSNNFGISMQPTFARFWFDKKFKEFQILYDKIPFTLDKNQENIDFLETDLHCAIRYGDGNYSNLVSIHLIDDYVTPVCNPQYFAELKQTNNIDVFQINHLQHTTLLQSQNFPNEWFQWLSKFNLQSAHEKATIAVHEECTSIIETAHNQRDFALANLIYVADYLQQGELVAPLASIDGIINPGFGWHLVYPEKHQNHPILKAFENWIVGAFQIQKQKNKQIIQNHIQMFETGFYQ